jgi:O-methyltransferase
MAEDAQASLSAAREPRAGTPGPGPDALRRAYLDLLKLALCDLVGTQTTSVGALEDRAVVARELKGDARALRVAGMDWPLHGLTMVGLRRLDDLQRCVEQVVADEIAGDLVEAGSWRGGASLMMRATLDTLGDERAVVVADSFQGFPAADDDQAVDHELLVAPLDDVRASFARLGLDRGVEFVPGFFEQTLAGLAGRRWALVRLDGDTYEATRVALHALYPGLAAGGVCVVDDYGSWEGCRRAVDEFRAAHGIEEPMEQVDFTCWRWRRTTEQDIEPLPAAPAAPAPVTAPAAGDLRVPAAEELELRRELAQMRERLAAAETELERWRGSLAGRLARRVGR